MLQEAYRQKTSAIRSNQRNQYVESMKHQVNVCTILYGCIRMKPLIKNCDIQLSGIEQQILRWSETWNKMYDIINVYKNELSVLISIQDSVKRYLTSGAQDDEVDTVRCVDVAQWTEYKDTRFKHVVGLSEAKQNFKRSLIYPIIYPRLYPESVKGILLYGSPGVGKTFIMKAVVNELHDIGFDKGVRVLMFNPTGAELKGKYVGETEKRIKKYFTCAQRAAQCCTASNQSVVSIIFIDEIDSIARSRSTDTTGIVASSVNTLLQMMEGVKSFPNVYVVGATNYPWQLDSAVLRRFKSRIYIKPVQTPEERFELMSNLINRYLRFKIEDPDKTYVNRTDKGDCDRWNFSRRDTDSLESLSGKQWKCDVYNKEEADPFAHDWTVSPYINRVLMSKDNMYTFLSRTEMELYSNSDLANLFEKATRDMAKRAVVRKVFQAYMYPTDKRVDEESNVINDFRSAKVRVDYNAGAYKIINIGDFSMADTSIKDGNTYFKFKYNVFEPAQYRVVLGQKMRFFTVSDIFRVSEGKLEVPLTEENVRDKNGKQVRKFIDPNGDVIDWDAAHIKNTDEVRIHKTSYKLIPSVLQLNERHIFIYDPESTGTGRFIMNGAQFIENYNKETNDFKRSHMLLNTKGDINADYYDGPDSTIWLSGFEYIETRETYKYNGRLYDKSDFFSVSSDYAFGELYVVEQSGTGTGSEWVTVRGDVVSEASLSLNRFYDIAYLDNLTEVDVKKETLLRKKLDEKQWPMFYAVGAAGAKREPMVVSFKDRRYKADVLEEVNSGNPPDWVFKQDPEYVADINDKYDEVTIEFVNQRIIPENHLQRAMPIIRLLSGIDNVELYFSFIGQNVDSMLILHNGVYSFFRSFPFSKQFARAGELWDKVKTNVVALLKMSWNSLSVDWDEYINAIVATYKIGIIDALNRYATYFIVNNEKKFMVSPNVNRLGISDDVNEIDRVSPVGAPDYLVVLSNEATSKFLNKLIDMYGNAIYDSKTNDDIEGRIKSYNFDIKDFIKNIAPDTPGRVAPSLKKEEIENLKTYSKTGKGPSK